MKYNIKWFYHPRSYS